MHLPGASEACWLHVVSLAPEQGTTSLSGAGLVLDRERPLAGVHGATHDRRVVARLRHADEDGELSAGRLDRDRLAVRHLLDTVGSHHVGTMVVRHLQRVAGVVGELHGRLLGHLAVLELELLRQHGVTDHDLGNLNGHHGRVVLVAVGGSDSEGVRRGTLAVVAVRHHVVLGVGVAVARAATAHYGGGLAGRLVEDVVDGGVATGEHLDGEVLAQRTRSVAGLGAVAARGRCRCGDVAAREEEREDAYENDGDTGHVVPPVGL